VQNYDQKINNHHRKAMDNYGDFLKLIGVPVHEGASNALPAMPVAKVFPVEGVNGSWKCRNIYCGNVNWRNRKECNVCNHPRPPELNDYRSRGARMPSRDAGFWDV
jgi:hypothetical protein